MRPGNNSWLHNIVEKNQPAISGVYCLGAKELMLLNCGAGEDS